MYGLYSTPGAIKRKEKTENLGRLREGDKRVVVGYKIQDNGIDREVVLCFLFVTFSE